MVTANDLIYATLMNAPKPDHVSKEDRHLFACLLSVAAQSAMEMSAALGLKESDIEAILRIFFPGIELSSLKMHSAPVTEDPPEQNDDVLSIILSHLPDQTKGASFWLAHTLSTRASHPGHLWVAMGLFERPELSAAIRRHLPSLAKANHQNMRWKRYLFKQVCDLNGGVMCKSPNCGVCSDYELCFAED